MISKKLSTIITIIIIVWIAITTVHLNTVPLNNSNIFYNSLKTLTTRLLAATLEGVPHTPQPCNSNNSSSSMGEALDLAPTYYRNIKWASSREVVQVRQLTIFRIIVALCLLLEQPPPR